MNLKLHPYQLEFVFPFRIAHGVRTHTDALFVELEQDGITAFGEATFPPYLPCTRQDAIDLLSRLDLVSLSDKSYIADLGVNPPALAALDMALWSLRAKMENTSIRSLLGISETFSPPRTYTISVCDRDEMRMRLNYALAKGFSFFKLKMDGRADAQMLADLRALTAAPFAVDANQAWSDSERAIAFSKELEQAGCVLIEQPFHRDDLLKTRALGSSISIPVIADEACQTYADIDRVNGYFSGINVKLQKCGGITPAYEMIRHAKNLGLKVLIGCMSESAVGCDAGEVLTPLCDWNDLDGKYLVKEVPFGE